MSLSTQYLIHFLAQLPSKQPEIIQLQDDNDDNDNEGHDGLYLKSQMRDGKHKQFFNRQTMFKRAIAAQTIRPIRPMFKRADN